MNADELSDGAHSDANQEKTNVPQSEVLFSEESQMIVHKSNRKSFSLKPNSCDVRNVERSSVAVSMSPVPEGSEIPDIRNSEGLSESSCHREVYCELQGNSIEDAMKLIEDNEMVSCSVCGDVTNGDM